MHRRGDRPGRLLGLVLAGALLLSAPGCESWQGTYTGTVARTVTTACQAPTGPVPGTAVVTINAPNPNGTFSIALNTPGSPDCLLLLQGYDNDVADILEATACQGGAAPPDFTGAGGTLADVAEPILVIHWTRPGEPDCLVVDTWTLQQQ